MSLRRDLAAAAAVLVAAVSAGSPASAQAPAASEPGLRPAHFVLPKVSGPDFDPHTLLVKFKPGTAARSRALAVGKATVQQDLPGAGFVKVTTTDPAETALASLRKDPSVAAVSLDYRRHLTATPADPYYALSQQPYLSTLRLPQAWDVVRDATSQVIAVVDTGVYLPHTDLAARLVPGYNVLSPGTPPADSDPNNTANTNAGHGTMVAGIAAAHSNNGRGIAGAAWASRIMPVKVFAASGGAADSDIATGITWAADHGATIVNLSLGGEADDPVLHAAIQYATSKGALVVVAAGNEGSDRPEYPAAYPEVLAVGATDWTGSLTSFSSHGDWVDVAAPGFEITSTFPHWLLPGGTSTDYATGSGTSFAAPLVSGIAALVRAKLPSLTPAQVLARLKATARDAGPRGLDPYYGAGIVDAARAVGGSYGAEFPQPAMGLGEPNDVPARATLARSVTLGTFGAEGDVDWYHFEMTTTSAMTMTVRGPKADATRAQNADPILELYDQDLHLLGRSDGLGVDAMENIKGQLSPGTFYIAVRNFNGAIDSRTYELEVAGYGIPSPALVPGSEQAWVRGVAPADFSVGQAQSVAPSVTFARELDPASVDASTVRLLRGSDGAPVDATAAYDPAARTVTLTPKSPLADNTPYRIAVGAVRDSAGTVNTEPFTTTFRTLNTAPPPITGLTVTGSRDGTATLAWDPAPISDLDVQPVRMATGTTPPATPTSGTAVYNGTTSSVRTPALAPGTTYTFRIWARDRTGLLSKPTDVVLRGTVLTSSGVPGSSTAGAVVPVSVKAGSALAGAPMTLQARGYNKPWGDVTTVTADAQGLATTPQHPSAYTEYRWQYRGGPGAGNATSAVTSLGVRALVTGSAAPASVAAGSAVQITGSVTPVKAGKPLQLQRLSGTAWVTVVAGTVPASGSYLFTVRPASRGTVTYRVAIPADTENLASTSPQLPVSVT